MEKIIAATVCSLAFNLTTAQPGINQHSFDLHLKAILNYANENFKTIPAGYKLYGAISGEVQKNKDEYTFHRSVMANATSPAKATKKLLLLSEKIKTALDSNYTYEEKNGAGNIIEINFAITTDSHPAKIRLWGYRAKNKIRVCVDIAGLNPPANRQAGIAERVKKIITQQLGVDEKEVTADASFTNDLGTDSLDTVELIMAFEKEFNISIPDTDCETIFTVGQAIIYIEKQVTKQ